MFRIASAVAFAVPALALAAAPAHAEAPEILAGIATSSAPGVEVDPFVVGDVCITFVEVDKQLPNGFPVGSYGIVEDIITCDLARKVALMGFDEIVLDADELTLVPPGPALEVLEDFHSHVIYLDRDAGVSEPLAEIRVLPENLAFPENSLGQLGLLDTFGAGSTDGFVKDVVLLGKKVFGNGCDLVPDSHAGIELKKNKNVFQFLGFLKHGTDDWFGVPSATQQQALRKWILEAGAENVSVLYGRESGDACGGSGQVSYNLIWNEISGEVLYLVMFPALD